jgi:hypothetical protein
VVSRAASVVGALLACGGADLVAVTVVCARSTAFEVGRTDAGLAHPNAVGVGANVAASSTVVVGGLEVEALSVAEVETFGARVGEVWGWAGVAVVVTGSDVFRSLVASVIIGGGVAPTSVSRIDLGTASEAEAQSEEESGAFHGVPPARTCPEFGRWKELATESAPFAARRPFSPTTPRGPLTGLGWFEDAATEPRAPPG